MTSSKGSGLPRGIYEHKGKFRTRRPGESTKWVAHHDAAELWQWKDAYATALKAGTRLPAELSPTYKRPTTNQATTFRDYAIGVWLPKYEQRGLVDVTVDTVLRNLSTVVAYPWTAMPLTSIRDDVLQAWVNETHVNHGPSVAKQMRGLVRRIIAAAVADPDMPITSNAATGVVPEQGPAERKTPRPKRTALPLETVPTLVVRLLATNWTAFWLGLLAGLRPGESFGLRVGDFKPPTGTDPYGYLTIHQQYGGAAADHAKDGVLTHFKPWPKTHAGWRTIPIAPTLAAYLVDEIERIYGHPLGDPWWSEPATEPWDPKIITNEDLPIVTPPSRPNVATNRHNQFTNALNKAAELENIDLRPSTATDDKAGPLTPRDLRKVFSTTALDHGVSGPARAAYLGHKHEATFEDADVTVNFYSPVTVARLASVADFAETQLIPLVGSLSPGVPATGDDRLVTIKDAMILFTAEGIGLCRKTLDDRIVAAELPCEPNPWAPRHTAGRHARWYRLRDLRALASPPPRDESTVTAAEVGAMCFPTLTRQRQGHLLHREVKLGNILRAGYQLYDRDSAAALASKLRDIESGALIPIEDWLRMSGRTAGDLSRDKIVHTSIGRYVDTALQASDVGNSTKVAHSIAAGALSLDDPAYWAVLRVWNVGRALELASRQTNEVILGWEFKELLRERDRLVALARKPVLEHRRPGADWIPMTEVAGRTGVPMKRLSRLATRWGYDVRVWNGETHLAGGFSRQVSRTVEGWLDSDELGNLLGCDADAALAFAAEHGWPQRDASGSTLTSLPAARAWARAAVSQPGGPIMTVDGAAAFLGVSVGRVKTLIATGKLRPLEVKRLLIFDRATGARVRILDYASVAAVAEPTSPTAVPLRTAAQLFNVKESRLKQAAYKGRLVAARAANGKDWIAEPQDVEAYLRRDAA